MGERISQGQLAAISQDRRGTPSLRFSKTQRVEALLEVVDGKLILAVSQPKNETDPAEQSEQPPLNVEIFLGREGSELVLIGSGKLRIQPGASLRLRLVTPGPAGEPLPVFAQRGASSRVILHEGQRLVLYRQAPLSEGEGGIPEGTLRLMGEGQALGSSQVAAATISQTVGNDLSPPAALPDRVAIQLRLLAPESTDEAGQLSVALAAPDVVGEAVFEVEWQAQVSRHRLRLATQTHLLVPLRRPTGKAPGEDPLPATETLRYRLTGRAGEQLLSGEVSLSTLLEEEEGRHGEVGPLQFDRPLYLPGDPLEVLVPIAGRVAQGYRLLIVGRGGDGALFHHVEMEVQETTLRLSLSLPPSLRAPASLEYQLRDRRSGFLYDQGAQPIPLTP